MFDQLRENFELILIVLFLISLLCYVIYRLTTHAAVRDDLRANAANMHGLKRKERKKIRTRLVSKHLDSPLKKIVYFFADLFWVLLFVVVVRSFLYEPFIIPSGSMKPGLQVGDIVLVNKFEKGLRLPVTNQRLTQGQPIKRGDVIVFKYPNNPKISYIKRVIGLPGDKVYYDNRRMIINGQRVPLSERDKTVDNVKVHTPQGIVQRDRDYTVYNEDLSGYKHTIRYSNHYPAGYPAREWIVPKGKYLMMGDNRDNSADGREFGFLDDSLVIGRAKRIALNFECLKGNGKCDRFFKAIR
ncbi:MAG: signal peptidase I [Gammaproteobacteria bacterium]|nr:MAG: signal peptidase I [Gammaproteobacteria bacterium]